jgi:Homeodomain-like domain
MQGLVGRDRDHAQLTSIRGLTTVEITTQLGVSERSVNRATSRYQEMSVDGPSSMRSNPIERRKT